MPSWFGLHSRPRSRWWNVSASPGLFMIAFIAYLFVLLGGLAGLAFVFVDELIGKDLTKKLSFVAGGVALIGAIFIFLFAAVFNAVNDRKDLVLDAAPIVFGIFGVLVAAINAAAPILEEKGY